MLEVELAQRAPIALDVRLHCAADELLALVGPSGSGKTSVLRAIAGLLDPAHGSVRLGDETWLDTAAGIHVPAERRQIGMVFQNYALFPHLSARENIRLAAPRGSPPDLPDRLLDELRLAGLAHRKPHELSGGQRQRVALARALARQPKLLLLDEAFSAVDHPTRMALYDELVALRSRVRLPIILVTHDLREARELADTICIMDAGETLQLAAPERVMAHPRNARVAALVGIRDIQPGVFRTHSSGSARLVWGHEGDELSLIVRDKGRIADGTRVHWVIAGQFVHLTREQPTGPNAVECEIDTVKALGALSTMACRPVQAPDRVVHVDTMTTLLRTLQIRPGERAHLQLESEGIHIMPVKDART